MEKPGRIPALDGLRGIAILLVVLYHSFGKGRASSTPLSWGWAGVDLFFVLSGFLIGGILWDTRRDPLLSFYQRRAWRILPPYLLLVSICFILHGHQKGEIPLSAYLTFSQNWFVVLFVFPGALGATWSLAIEEQFYLASPWVFRRLSKRAVVATLLLTCAAAAVFRSLIAQPGLRYQLTICRADAIAVGCLVALAWREPAIVRWLGERRALVTGTWMVLGALCVWILSGNTWDKLVEGYSAIAMLCAASLWIAVTQKPRWLAWWPLTRAGRISYGLYLYHSAIAEIARPWFSSSVMAFLILVPVSWCAAEFSWRYLERPLLERRRRLDVLPQVA